MLTQQNIWLGKVETGFPDSAITVLKFGGTSVKDKESWEKIKEIIILRKKWIEAFYCSFCYLGSFEFALKYFKKHRS